MLERTNLLNGNNNLHYKKPLPTDKHQLLSNIADRVPGMIAVYSVKTGEYVYVNNAIKKILGYTPEDFIKKGFSFVSSLVHPDDLASIMDINQKALDRANKKKMTGDDEPIVNFEYRMKDKRGHWKWLHTDGSVLSRGADGKIEYVLNISVDMTARKQKEDKTDRLKDKFKTKVAEVRNTLALSEERFRLIAQKVQDYAIFMLDREGNILSWNRGAQRIKGYKTKEIIGKNFSIFYTAEDRAKKVPQKKLSYAIKDGRYEDEGIRVRKDGTRFWAHVVITALMDEHGQLQGFVKVTSDITEKLRTRQRQILLDKINTVVAASFEQKISLERIARYITSNMADYCRIALVDENGTVNQIAARHIDGTKTQLIKDLYDQYKGDSSKYGISHILKSGKPEIISRIDDSIFKMVKANPTLIKNMKDLGLKSYMGVPLIARGKVVGAITFSSTREERMYSQNDLNFAQELGRRIGLYIDNVRLYSNAQKEIKERIKVEQRLLDNQQRLELAQKVGRIGTYEWDFISNKIYWSPELEAVYGLKPGTFGGSLKAWQKFIAPKERKSVSHQIQEQIRRGDEAELVFKVILKDESIHWMYLKSKIFFGKNKKPIRAVGINMDITERIITENNLQFLAQASKVLSSSLDFQTTLNTVARLAVPEIADWCGVDMLDSHGEMQQLAVAHKDPKKVKWAKLYRKQNPPPRDAKTGLPNILRTGKSELYPVITDEMLVASSQTKKQLELARSLNIKSAMVVPIFSQKKPIGAISFVTTETRRHYGPQDLAMAEELANRASLAIENATLYKGSQDAITIRDDFISVASHELKTPVTSVKIFTQVLQQHSKQIGDDKAVLYLGKMERQLNKLTELIYNLLDISKIQAGRIEFNNKVFDFDNAVKDIIDVLQVSSPKHKIILMGKTDTKIYGDEDRIEQVISNLVSNAIKYSPTADKVIIKLKKTEDSVIVAVQDFGIGMSRGHLKRIFERFYRVYDATDKTFPGLGIGLYISSEIIKRHEGKIWVESKNGEGSTFYFSLPIKHN